jgi:hypothetical protein
LQASCFCWLVKLNPQRQSLQYYYFSRIFCADGHGFKFRNGYLFCGHLLLLVRRWSAVDCWLFLTDPPPRVQGEARHGGDRCRQVIHEIAADHAVHPIEAVGDQAAL